MISGELNKKANKWQILHPDYILNINDNNEIPLYETKYPLTFGLTHRKIKIAIKESTKLLPNFNEWINADLILIKNWKSFNESLYKIHYPNTLQEINNNKLYRERIAYDEALSRQLALNLIRKYKSTYMFLIIDKLTSPLNHHLL